MNNDPLVSIVIPVYNVETYVERAIDSACRQTYPKIELLLINDGSTDQSGAICHKAQERDHRIRVLEQPNQGSSSARNRGITQASGDYIFFLDADDTIEPQTIELMSAAMLEHKCDLVFGGWKEITINNNNEIQKEKNLILPQIGFYKKIDILKNLRSNHTLQLYNFDSTCNKLYKTAHFRDNNIFFPTQLRYSEDSYLLIDLLDQCEQIYYIGIPFYNYYIYHQDIRQSSVNSVALSERFNIYKQLYIKLSNKIFASLPAQDIRLCKHNFADKVILACIMLCHPLIQLSQKQILQKLNEIVHDDTVIDVMKYYKREPQNSWTIPLLIKRKRPDLLLHFVSKRAKKRYL